VGLDNNSPTWSSPLKSKGEVFQNDQINFSVAWQDNIGLNNFVFSISQGSTWSNYSSGNLSGISDSAIQQAQISASANVIIYWRMYAWDTSGNINVTDIQNFTVAEQELTPSPPPSTNEDSGSGITSLRDKVADLGLTPTRKLKDFKLGLFDIKLSMKQGTTKTVVLKITNIGTEDLSIEMDSTALWDFIIFSEESFDLLPGNSKELTIDFDIPRSAYPGQYFGFVWANSGDINKTVPVVLDIHAIDLDYDIDINISEEYKLIRPGEDIEAGIYIYNIKDLFETNATLYYAVKDFTGTIYNFSEEPVSFSTTLTLNRSLTVPEKTQEGKYIFYVRVSDDNNTAIDSDVFEVGERFTLSAFLKSKGVFILVFFLAFFLAIFMVKYQRELMKEKK